MTALTMRGAVGGAEGNRDLGLAQEHASPTTQSSATSASRLRCGMFQPAPSKTGHTDD